jgi:DNA-3-methyladenine glycosylase II
MNFSTPGASFPCTQVLLTNSISPWYVFSPTMTINTPPNTLAFELSDAIRHLSERDDTLRALIAEVTPFQIDVADTQSPYEVLLESIAYQSISGKAAATIFGRIKALGTDGRPPSPEQMLKTPVAKLRKAGLSGAKVLAMKDLAKKALAGIVPTHEEALKLSDEELVERLISVRGIGAWTVEMFLIFRLGRPDVLPIHDLGVKKGWSVAYGKKHMPKPKELLEFGERWRPYRTVASWYMWRAFERAGYKVTNKIRPRPVRKKKNRKAEAKQRGRKQR